MWAKTVTSKAAKKEKVLKMSVAGVFDVTINSPMGSQQGTLTLNQDGDAVSGQMEGPQGTQEFSGGTADGSSAAWVVDMTQPMPMKLEFSAAVDGDAISGDVKLGAFGSATFSGTRKG